MERVPDMDSLLDEIEDSVECSLPRRVTLESKTIIKAPTALKSLDNEQIDMKIESVTDYENIWDKPDCPSSPVKSLNEEPIVDSDRFIEDSLLGSDLPAAPDVPIPAVIPVPAPDVPVAVEPPALAPDAAVPVEPPVQDVSERDDRPQSIETEQEEQYDEALEYLNQLEDDADHVECSLEPAEPPAVGMSDEEELLHVAESVAESIVQNCMSRIKSCALTDILYSSAPGTPSEEEKIPFQLDETSSEAAENINLANDVQCSPDVISETIVPDEIKDEVVTADLSVEFECDPVCDSADLTCDAVERSSPIEYKEEHAETGGEPEIHTEEVPEEHSDDGAQQPSQESLQENSTENNLIATVHNLEQESSSGRLTESELMLGKQKPYWIPDGDCDSCMLCTIKFSILIRRHHCRACGRVLCYNCCNKKAVLDYMKSDPDEKKTQQARVCLPCMTMLLRIQEYEHNRSESAPEETSSSKVRGVLKSRSEQSDEAQDAPVSEATSSKRSVTFRDGVNPGSTSGSVSDPEKTTALKPKKKSRKRPSVVRKITEMKLEAELASALPTTSSQPFLIRQSDGSMSCRTAGWSLEQLQDNNSVTVILRKNLCCTINATQVFASPVWSVVTDGFAAVGLEELLFVWEREAEDFTLPTAVLERVSQIFKNALDSDSTGVHLVSSRFPLIQSSVSITHPLPKHILFYRPTSQDFGTLQLPSNPFLVACFLCDCELPWVMACPNRLLFRLGLKYGTYPYPFINCPNREPVFSLETNYTVLKVFTDFRNWSYRMKSISGATITLTNDTTIIRIPRVSQDEINSIVEWNRSMIAWCCDHNVHADSHLVCEDCDGVYTTHVLAGGCSRNATGASFVIIDGGLKTTAKLQVSVVEDGVAVRLQAEQFRLLSDALCDKELKGFTVSDENGSQLVIEWVDSEQNASVHTVRSALDGIYLQDKYQYGLSLERALTAVLEVASAPGIGVRLSHVYNLNRGRLLPEDEPKVFSIVEMLARECSALLDPSLQMLLQLGIRSISLRFLANRDTVEYDVSPWHGLEEENAQYRESMDKLIPVLCNVIDYVSAGIHIEFILSFVSTASLPIPE